MSDVKKEELPHPEELAVCDVRSLHLSTANVTVNLPISVPVVDFDGYRGAAFQIIEHLSAYIKEHCPPKENPRLDLPSIKRLTNVLGHDYEVEFNRMDGEKAIFKCVRKEASNGN